MPHASLSYTQDNAKALKQWADGQPWVRSFSFWSSNRDAGKTPQETDRQHRDRGAAAAVGIHPDFPAVHEQEIACAGVPVKRASLKHSSNPHSDMRMNCCMLLLMTGIGVWAAGQEPVTEGFKDSAANRWLNKQVITSRVLDDMESPAKWIAFTTGAPDVVDARAANKSAEASHTVVEITLSRERSRDGRRSLHMRMPARLDVPGPKNGRGWGSAGVRRHVDGEDWRPFNRLALWIYPDCPGWRVVALELQSNRG